jgi:hypothetical protein
MNHPEQIYIPEYLGNDLEVENARNSLNRQSAKVRVIPKESELGFDPS